MDQQSEHLTDAQIETYGDRNTGAGPSGPGDNTAQAVEAHLADCAGCRTRLLEFHRSRLGLMKDRSQAPAPRPDDPSRQADLSPSTDIGLSTRSSGRDVPSPFGSRTSDDPPPGADCPINDSLRDLAAGITAESEAARLIHHAAHCDHCGPVLRAYTEDFSDDLSPEDATLLAQLNSASPSWQKKLAEQMAAAVVSVAQPPSLYAVAQPPSAVDADLSTPSTSSIKSTPSTRPRVFSLKWLLIPAAAAACAVIAFFIWNSQRETPEKVEKLLAQAYTEQRTMEMRIPYAAHADFKQTRAGDTASLLSSPEALRKATDVIAANLKKNPGDPYWLLLSARLDLLDWRYKSALSTLNKIDNEKAEDSPEFRLTQSLALYEKAEIEHDPQSYGQVIDLLGKTLQKTPDDLVALFNQAVACEKLFMYECATNGYEHFLNMDPNSGWSGEAREHLNRLREKKTPEPNR